MPKIHEGKASYSQSEWRWLGHKMHFIGAGSCSFGMATELPRNIVVSTVGEYRPLGHENIEDLALNAKYETMVFKTTDKRRECGCPIIKEWIELDCNRYNDALDAQKGHVEMCHKWAAKQSHAPIGAERE
jgi:hypothetical protein